MGQSGRHRPSAGLGECEVGSIGPYSYPSRTARLPDDREANRSGRVPPPSSTACPPVVMRADVPNTGPCFRRRALGLSNALDDKGRPESADLCASSSHDGMVVSRSYSAFGAELRQTGQVAPVTLGYLGSGHPDPEVEVGGTWVRRAGRSAQSWASASPTETPQLSDTAADPHRNPTDETAHSGTLVMRVKGTENSRSTASMRVSRAVGAFSR